MKRLTILAGVWAFLTTLGCTGWAAERPNILFIMSDDHAAQAISAYGSYRNNTPHLDRLASSGMRFDNVFATNSICTPSRATILTGKYSHKNGTPVFNRFDGSQPHVAKYLQEAGYYTGVIGKWHLGSEPTGFDVWKVLPGQGRYNDPDFMDSTGRYIIPGYATDVITDLSIDFLRNRPKNKPFFLMSHHKAPHREWTPNPKYTAEFKKKTFKEPDNLRDNYESRTSAIKECRQKVFEDLNRRDLKLTPPEGMTTAARNAWLGEVPDQVVVQENGTSKTLTGAELDNWQYQRYMQDYLGCVQSIDDNVGRLLDYLDSEGLSSNTLVIYTSDQGFFLGEHGLYDKRFMYEESIRMPFLARWPGVTKAGTTQAAMATNVDFAPTFLAAAGVKIPGDMQGRSLIPLLKGEKPADWRKSWYYRYYHDPGDHNTRQHYGVRTDTHKLIHFWKSDEWECYDLVRDPKEMHNIYADPAAAEIVAELKAELARLKKEVDDKDEFAEKLPPQGVAPPPHQGPIPVRPMKDLAR